MRKQNIYNNQMAFCVPTSELNSLDKDFTEYSELCKFKDNRRWTFFDNMGKYLKRDMVEGRYEFTQLIPYLVIVNADGDILVHKSKKSDKISLGFSTHITPEIGKNNSVIFNALMTLSLENLGDFAFASPLILDGFIKSYTENTLGHIGIMAVLYVDNLNISNTEDITYEFMDKEDIFNNYGKLEEWGKIALSRFFK